MFWSHALNRTWPWIRHKIWDGGGNSSDNSGKTHTLHRCAQGKLDNTDTQIEVAQIYILH